MRPILSSSSPIFPSVYSNWLRLDDLPRTNACRSLSSPAIFFSRRAFSSRSVLPDSTATYSEKFMPLPSSMPPSSMVRTPRRFCLSWRMNSCLLCSSPNL